jgi:chromosome partitioning protein
MDPGRVSNLEKARDNASAFADEMLSKMPVRLTASARIAAHRLMSRAA